MRLVLIALALVALAAAPAYTDEILDAVMDGDQARVAELLRSDPSLANADSDPLGMAAYFGHVEIVQMLLAAGASVDNTDSDAQTALHAAAQEGHVPVVRLLLDSGASIDPTDERDRTPLRDAAERGHPEAAMLLVQRGADVLSLADDCLTPIHAAALAGETDLALTMLRRVDATADTAALPQLHRAVALGDEEQTKRLLSADRTRAAGTDQAGWTPLVWAAALGQTAPAALLLDAGADANAVAKNGCTALHAAAEAGRTQTITLLLSRGARPDARDEEGRTPLYCAIEAKHLEAARALLAGHADPNLQADSGQTPLHRAAFGVNLEAVQLLLTNGANATLADDDGETALHRVAWSGYLDLHSPEDETPEAKRARFAACVAVARALLRAGADAGAVDEDGDTPLHRAAQGGSAEMVQALLAAGAKVDARDEIGCTPLLVAHTKEAAEPLIKRGADLHARSNEGATILHYVVEDGGGESGEQFILYLTSQGLDINECRDKAGFTPLHWSVKGLLIPKVGEFLITKAGAKTDVRSDAGLTPLHVAALSGDVELVKMLLAHGADPGAKDNAGRTPLDYAAAAQADDIAAALQGQTAGAGRGESQGRRKARHQTP